MRRLHVLTHPEHEMGGEIYYREDKYRHDPELLEAYKCGKKDGWREAMAESESYHERHYPQHGGHILYREHDFREPYPDEIEYRRRGNGRYY